MCDSDTENYSRYPEDPIYIRVIAPATLKEGYSFDVMVQDKPFTVVVPEGGVKEGQEFTVEYTVQQDDPVDCQENDHKVCSTDDSYREYDSQTSSNYKNGYHSDHDNYDDRTLELGPSGDTHDKTKSNIEEDNSINNCADHPSNDEFGVPLGRWRTTLCSCCDVFTQATFWMGICCTPILIAQLITRLKLTWNGQDGYPVEETSLSFNRLVFAIIFVLMVSNVLPLVGSILILPLLYLVVVVHIGSTVRRFMRTKYHIPPSRLCRKNESFNADARVTCSKTAHRWNSCHNRVDDCCCMFWCGCCSTIQMARHTHNDKEYPGSGCTTSGLEPSAPQIV